MECSCPPGKCLGIASIYDCRFRRYERLLADPELYAEVAHDLMAGRYDSLSMQELRDLIDKKALGGLDWFQALRKEQG